MFNRITIAVILFLIVLITGILLRHKEKPLPTVLFTVHKLSAIAATIIIGRILYNQYTQRPETITPLVAAASLLTLFITGCLLSIDKTATKPIRILHVLTTATTVLTITAVLMHA